MCGVVSIYTPHSAQLGVIEALMMMQHRGQSAAGICTMDKERFHYRKKNGLVREVFNKIESIEKLKGDFAIGHVRYPTAGSDDQTESQPLYVNSPYGISLAHNGNITNTDELKKQLSEIDHRHISSESDTEILLNIFAHELQARSKDHQKPKHIFEAVSRVNKLCRGAFSVVAVIGGHGMLAFRDPHGIRPLVWGSKKLNGKTEYMFASESHALTSLDFTLHGDVGPGEALFVDMNGDLHREQCSPIKVFSPCIFEYIYFARPDSIFAGASVYSTRANMGKKLGHKIKKCWQHFYNDIDVVIPIPDSSRIAAIELSKVLNIQYREGLVKNHYVGRTFIMNDQQTRTKSIKRKLNFVTSEFKGKNVLLVDDSIVRGNTSKQIVKLAREAGAKKVYLASAAPPVRFPNVYGIDMPTREELIAFNKEVPEICKEIGCNDLIFQDMNDLIASVRDENSQATSFDCSVFDGKYVTGNIDENYFQKVKSKRAETKVVVK